MNITLLPPHPASLSSSIIMITLVTKEVVENCDIWFIQKPCIFYVSLIVYNFNKQARREQDGRGAGGHGEHLSSRIHQEYTFRHRNACRTPAESGQEYLTSGKEYVEPQKLSRTEKLGGKTGVLVGLDLPSAGGGNWSRGPIPTVGQLSESEEKHLRLRVKQLICGSLNGMRIRQSLPQPYIAQTGMQVPWKVQRLEAGV